MKVIKRCEADVLALKALDVDPDDLLDDGTDWLNVKVKKPWGHEVERYRDERLSIWWLHLHSGKETSLHCHPNKTTTLCIMGGEATLITLSGEHRIGEGDVIVVEPGAFHCTRSNGDPVVMYETESPPNKRDLVRLTDAYGRGQGYEAIQRDQILSKVG